MIFLDTYFLLFVLISVPVFHLAPQTWRRWIIVLSGIAFYTYNAGWWVVLFFSELFLSLFYKKDSKACRLGIFQAILVLAIFKYGSFFEENVRSVFSLGPGHLASLLPVLPLAISFFTFEFITFAADVHSGKVTKYNFLGYASFIFFFPTLVAGPIKRYNDFSTKLDQARFSWENVHQGITRILLGFFKKLVIADSFFKWTQVLDVHSIPTLSGVWIWQAVFAYGLRIYFDFSGYADIAIGTAYLFGIVVPENFNNPYASKNISEFWKRWHISLYRWLVDYIFIPLGGSRVTPWKVYRNIMIVTTVSGLWHGASWNFLFWGWYHGILLCIFHFYQSRPQTHSHPHEKKSLIRQALGWSLNFGAVMFGWTFFAIHSDSLPLALKKMFFLP